MKRTIIFLLLFLSCSSCGLWKKKNLQSSSMERQVSQYQIDSTKLQQLVKDSIVWEQEQWRDILFFEDSLHSPMLVREHIKSKALKQASQLTRQESHQVQNNEIHQKEKVIEEVVLQPIQMGRYLWWFGILFFLLLLYFYWRRFKVF